MAQRTGWDAVGYGLAGGFEKDRTEREKIQALDAAKAGLQYDPASNGYSPAPGSDLELLQQQNMMLTNQLKEVQNNITTKSQWESIVDGVNTGNYKSFNEQMNTNPTLAKVFKEKMGVQSVKTLNPWDNDDQLAAYTKVGMNPAVIDYVKDQRDKIMGGEPSDLNREDYLTMVKQIGTAYPIIEKSDGSLEGSSLEEFLAMTNLSKHATKSEERKQVFDVIAQGKLSLTGVTDKAYQNSLAATEAQTASVEAKTKQQTLETEDAASWLQKNPDKTYMDYQSMNKTTSGKMTSAGLKSEFADLQVSDSKGELDSDGKIRLKVLDKLFSTDNDEKREILEKGMEITKKYKDKLFDPNTEITNEDLTTATLYSQQAGLKADTKATRDFKDEYNTLEHGRRLVDDVNVLKEEELSRGLIDTGIMKAKKLLSDEAFQKMDKEQQLKELNSVKMNTKLGMFLAKYIKSISGTAVADAEFKRLTDLFSGSAFNNVQTLKEGVITFVEELDKNFVDKAKTSLMQDTPTTLDLVRRYKQLKPMPHRGSTETAASQQTPPKPAGKSYSKTAVNPKTGERMGLTENGWEKIN